MNVLVACWFAHYLLAGILIFKSPLTPYTRQRGLPLYIFPGDFFRVYVFTFLTRRVVRQVYLSLISLWQFFLNFSLGFFDLLFCCSLVVLPFVSLALVPRFPSITPTPFLRCHSEGFLRSMVLLHLGSNMGGRIPCPL